MKAKQNKQMLNEVRRMQQLAGILKEDMDLPQARVPDAIAMTIFLDSLGVNSKDPIFKGDIGTGNVEGVLDLIDDMVDLESSYSQSDIIAAMEEAQFSQDLIDRIVDQHPVVSRLERG